MNASSTDASSSRKTSTSKWNKPDEKELSDLAVFANELADTARKAILPYWRLSTLKVEHKFEEGRSECQVNSPVTIADQLAERNIRDMIEKRYPDHGILGEEFGSVRVDSKWLWVLDPIDGTKSFIAGKPLFGTLIALLYNGVPVIGIIDQCVLKERWLGVFEKPTTLNGEIVQCSRSVTSLSQSMLFATTPAMFAPGYETTSFENVAKKCRYSNYGTDCYSYALVASGYEAHIVVEADLGLYDYCAIVPVIQGSGGVMTDWNGNPLTLKNHEPSKGRVVACANSTLHEQAIQVLNNPEASTTTNASETNTSDNDKEQLLNVKIGMSLAIGVAIGMMFSRYK